MQQLDSTPDLEIIGSTELIEIAGIKDIPAKIDTGADTSAIWASNIDMQPDGTLIFSLFAEGSQFYSGERLETSSYRTKRVRSSHGDEQLRYQVELPVIIHGQAFKTAFTLADRSRNAFPVLVGRRTLKGKYLVDVSRNIVPRQRLTESAKLSEELSNNPYKFHQKYFNND